MDSDELQVGLGLGSIHCPDAFFSETQSAGEDWVQEILGSSPRFHVKHTLKYIMQPYSTVPVHKITLPLARYSTVCATLLRHSSDR